MGLEASKVSQIQDFTPNDFTVENPKQMNLRVERKAILIVEDDRFSRTLLSNLIEKNFGNLRVLTAKSFGEAKNIFYSEKSLDLIILDIFLDSNETGIDLLDLIAKSKQSPKVLISSVLEKGRVLQMLRKNSTDIAYIMKPAHPDRYLHAVESLLSMEAE